MENACLGAESVIGALVAKARSPGLDPVLLYSHFSSSRERTPNVWSWLFAMY